MVAGILFHLGIEFGNSLMLPMGDNPKGYFERTDLYLLHEELFAMLDHRGTIPVRWPLNHLLMNRLPSFNLA